VPETGGVKLVAGQGDWWRSPVTPNCGWSGRAARKRGVAATAAGRGAFHGHVVVLTPGTRTPRAGPTAKPTAALNCAGVIVRSASRLHLPDNHAPRPQGGDVPSAITSSAPALEQPWSAFCRALALQKAQVCRCDELSEMYGTEQRKRAATGQMKGHGSRPVDETCCRPW
jgi:hypothetical protein